jgi:hypothetical protein
MSSGPYFKPSNCYHRFFIPYLRNHWTSEKYLAMIVPPCLSQAMSSWQRLRLAKGRRNQSTSKKYLAMIVLPKPCPRNEFRGNASNLKRSQELIHTLLEKPVDQRKIFGTGRAPPQPSRPPEIDDPGS